MAAEATNAWWKRLRRREMDLVALERAVTDLLALDIVWVAATLLRPAARLAAELGHPVSDCIYLGLAASHSAVLATADERLTNGCDAARSASACASGTLGVRSRPFAQPTSS
jgi:predicted nucleic acid-binding protein